MPGPGNQMPGKCQMPQYCSVSGLSSSAANLSICQGAGMVLMARHKVLSKGFLTLNDNRRWEGLHQKPT